ncbi:MAG: hypothetical protein NZM38_03165 [Cytophagales bacterium]|nr:hypothetical protein [Cytophagales bacterium]MDW8383753.1 hypothetical protein [Flammeovirgaceae bacterium]
MQTKCFLILTFLLLFNLLIAQTPKEHPKGSYVDSLNRYYQQADLPLYVYFSHTPDGPPIKVSPDDSPLKKNELRPIYLDGHGKHFIRHFDDLHQNTENYVVYADGIAPVSSISHLNAPVFVKGTTTYFGKGLRIRLQTKDEMSGVNQLYVSVTGEEYAPYKGEFDMQTEGEQNIQFYAVDNVGNAEKPKSSKFIVDLSAPKTYYNIVGIAQGYIISTSTKIYLTPTDSISGVARTYYKLNDEPEKLYTGGNINFSYLPDGEHTLYWYSIDNVQNQEEMQSYKFYLDKTAPIMSADVLGDKFIVNDRVYFSGRTKLKLTAVDNKSGIKEVLYSIDGGEYQTYTEPFYLPNKAGLHVVRYYALDNMSNEGAGNRYSRYEEYRHNVSTVYVDLTGPTMGHLYNGPKFQKGDTIFINSLTKIRLIAEDPESGLQKITYSINDQQEETLYSEPFSIPQSGLYKIDYFGYDNVNNRNIDKFMFIVDNDGPEIYHHFSIKPNRQENGVDVFPAYTNLYLAATDWMVGCENIRYSINGGKEQIYNGIIFGFEKGKEYTIMVSAVDKLGNRTSKEIKFKTERY